jgi:hypothetical protein
LRDDAIPTLFLVNFRFINNSCIIHEIILNYVGYTDELTPSKKCRKQTTSPLSNNPEGKLDGRTTTDGNSVEVTLGGENGIEHTPTSTRT